MNTEEIVQLDVKEIRPFLRSLFYNQGASDQFTWIDERGLSPEFYAAIERLAIFSGGEAVRRADDLPAGDEARLGILIGRSRHLKLNKTAWEILVATLPAIVDYVAGSIGPAGTVAAVIGSIHAVVSNLERLESDEWLAYMLIKSRVFEKGVPVARSEILQLLGTREGRDPALCLASMVRKGVLAEVGDSLSPVF